MLFRKSGELVGGNPRQDVTERSKSGKEGSLITHEAPILIRLCGILSLLAGKPWQACSDRDWQTDLLIISGKMKNAFKDNTLLASQNLFRFDY